MARAPRVFLAAPYSQWMNSRTGTVEPLWAYPAGADHLAAVRACRDRDSRPRHGAAGHPGAAAVRRTSAAGQRGPGGFAGSRTRQSCRGLFPVAMRLPTGACREVADRHTSWRDCPRHDLDYRVGAHRPPGDDILMRSRSCRALARAGTFAATEAGCHLTQERGGKAEAT